MAFAVSAYAHAQAGMAAEAALNAIEIFSEGALQLAPSSSERAASSGESAAQLNRTNGRSARREAWTIASATRSCAGR